MCMKTVMNQFFVKRNPFYLLLEAIRGHYVIFAKKSPNPSVFPIVIFFTALVSGCGSTYMGTKFGYDVPLQTADATIRVNNESNKGAYGVGAVFEQYMSPKFSLLIEPSVTSKFSDEFNVVETTEQTTLDIYTKHSYSIFQIPIIAKFTAPIEGSSYKPYFGVGARIVSGSRGILGVSGTYTDTSRISRPFDDYHSTTSSSGSLDAILCAGVDWTLSDTWLLRFDTRYQRGLTDLYSIEGYAVTPRGYPDRIFSIRQSLEHLSFSLSLLLKL